MSCMFVCFATRHISYLPLAHIYERMNLLVMLHHGVAVGFFQGVRNSF
jgi:long-subunit acyl-CoA synthetase (AMP-forming)